MIPLSDNLFQLTERLPQNPLTAVLRDFRSYRPTNHTAFLAFVETAAKSLGVRAYALANVNSRALLIQILDRIREFRARHWMFTKEYIIKQTSHPTGTG